MSSPSPPPPPSSNTANSAENSEEFWIVFPRKIAEVREAMNALQPETTPPPSASNLQERLQETKALLDRLQEYLSLSTIALAAYDRKRSVDLFEGLRREFKEAEARLLPKKKFAFSNRSKITAAPSTTPSSSSAQPVKGEGLSTALLPLGSFVIADKSNESLLLPTPPAIPDFIGEPQLFLKTNKACEISLPWLSGSARLEDLEACEVFLGPCMTSVYLENLRDCLVFACCHQLRIHNCQNCQFYVRANSHPIIEDCQGLRFAPYTLSYPGIEADLEKASLQTASCWDNVVDFRWLKSVKSPNWAILEENDRRNPPTFPKTS